jgi:Bacterial regulatory proteins, luxR family
MTGEWDEASRLAEGPVGLSRQTMSTAGWSASGCHLQAMLAAVRGDETTAMALANVTRWASRGLSCCWTGSPRRPGRSRLSGRGLGTPTGMRRSCPSPRPPSIPSRSSTPSPGPGRRPRAAGDRLHCRAPGRLLTGVAAPQQQREIVGLAAAGLTNKQIGGRLFLSPHTVSTPSLPGFCEARGDVTGGPPARGTRSF